MIIIIIMVSKHPSAPLFDRKEEMAFLNSTLRQSKAQLTLMYGRRRVGKTHLLGHWVHASPNPSTYWMAIREPAALQRRRLYAAVLGLEESSAPSFENWPALWSTLGAHLERDVRAQVIVLDELPYAAEADPAMLPSMQHFWDHTLQHRKGSLVLCGSHVRTMETLLEHASPLFGRFTGQWHLNPLPFATLREFFPSWSAEERVALFAVVGGMPAYLSWLNPDDHFEQNLRNVVFARGSMFSAEPAFLLSDELREPGIYAAILRAIAQGAHALEDIARVSSISKSHLSAYLDKLQTLRMVERRLPATLRPAERAKSRRGRYHLQDAYMRFFYRFIAPHQSQADYNPDEALRNAKDGLRAFVGATAFEELARSWVQKKTGLVVGSSWSADAQVDVVSVDWDKKQLWVGECKWGDSSIGRDVAVELLTHKIPAVCKDVTHDLKDWTVTPLLFGRRAFTAPAQDLIKAAGGECVSLARLDAELA